MISCVSQIVALLIPKPRLKHNGKRFFYLFSKPFIFQGLENAIKLFPILGKNHPFRFQPLEKTPSRNPIYCGITARLPQAQRRIFVRFFGCKIQRIVILHDGTRAENKLSRPARADADRLSAPWPRADILDRAAARARRWRGINFAYRRY